MGKYLRDANMRNGEPLAAHIGTGTMADLAGEAKSYLSTSP
jgi:hypothetical protein